MSRAKLVNKITEMKNIVNDAYEKDLEIGLVPTMGHLHNGHISLIKRSVKENDITIVSIFVNPIQFGKGEDYDSYPRDLTKDIEMIDRINADYIFTPEITEMYPDGYDTFIEIGKITKPLCGISRPTHFKGVATVVAKLFNICNPKKAYFGQKDFQQTVVIKKMVKDLNIDVKVIVCQTVRESDGLAMSSRNSYLSDKQRDNAQIIYRSLQNAKKLIEKGETDPKIIIQMITSMINEIEEMKIDYIDIRRQNDLSEVKFINEKIVIAIAVKLGYTRLIDNILIGGKNDADNCS